MFSKIHFLLNDKEICASAHPGTLVLDYLRRILRLTGTKEGCREGDCGACTVLIGEYRGDRVIYKSVTSCLMPLGELHGKHLVTIEGLNLTHLSPVQQAIVEEGATQCGFCTPGIVVSLTGYLMKDNTKIHKEGVKKTLSGHLCRCTGYRSLKQSACFLRNEVKDRTGINTLVANNMLPGYFLEIPDRLRKIPSPAIESGVSGKVTPGYFVAGGTDIYVQKGEVLVESGVYLLNMNHELKKIYKKDGYVHVGALTTFEEFANHPEIINGIPHIQTYMSRVASLQIRNRATLGGNVINASPIGDLTILLLALDAILVLKNDGKSRSVPMMSFYTGYKQLDKIPSEILVDILIPESSADNKINFEKVSKRKYLDIASVNSAMKIRCEDGIIREITLAMGGVAPIPLILKATGNYLFGKQVCKEEIEGAFPIVQQEISPINDVRGSVEYKRLLAKQLIIAHFTKLFPEKVAVRDFYET